MDGKIKDDAIQKLLGLNEDKVADIFAVGLQEHCWRCNKDDMWDIPEEFLKRLSQSDEFEIVGIRGTRVEFLRFLRESRNDGAFRHRQTRPRHSTKLLPFRQRMFDQE